jgi:predicted adenylyl cyclase CyaB
VNEVEVKIIDIDRTAVESRLRELGAKRGADESLAAVFFDFPDRRLKGAGHLLRLRREGRRSVLTFKRRIGEEGAKVREETEIEVSDFEACTKVLSALGLEQVSRVEKQRTSYRLGDASIALDRHTGELCFIPEFLEIEADSVDGIRAIAAALGFGPDRLLPWGLPQVIEHYRARS